MNEYKHINFWGSSVVHLKEGEFTNRVLCASSHERHHEGNEFSSWRVLDGVPASYRLCKRCAKNATAIQTKEG